MAGETIVAWKVGADDMDVTIGNTMEVDNQDNSEESLGLKLSNEDGKKTSVETNEKETVCRVSSTASYGSIGSFGSFGDDQGDERGGRPLRKKSKKMSVCSNMSTLSNTSEQPYLSMMSNVSRDRTMSVGSVRTRKISEGIPPFISMMAQNDSTPGEFVENSVCQDQSWVAQNPLYGNGKKIYFKNFHGKEKMRRRGEIFPGYEKTIQERASHTEAEHEQEFKEDDEHQETQEKPNISDHRRSSLNPRSLAAKQIDNIKPREGASSASDLEPHFTRHGLRSTVCSADIRSRSMNSSSKATTVARSQSMKKPFQKIGDGFLKTFRHLKKK